MSRPRAVIFDLGGVLITSPLKAIEEYEFENDIPSGYLNYAMYGFPQVLPNNRVTAEPNTWAELETGLLRTDETFYSRWSADLASPKAWEQFHHHRGLQLNRPPPQTDAEALLKRMIIPKEGGKLVSETFTALRKLKGSGVITCGLTNNFVFASKALLK